jgi:hypothetical protein
MGLDFARDTRAATAVEAGVSPAQNCSGGCVSRARVELRFRIEQLKKQKA